MPKSRMGGQNTANPPQNTQPTTPPAPPQASGPRNYQAMDDTTAQNLRDLQEDMYNGSVEAALKMYISGKPGTAAADFDGKGHSLSQTLNYLDENGIDINTVTVSQLKAMGLSKMDGTKLASMQYTSAYMSAGMHPIGQDTILTRAAHSGIINNVFGIKNWNNMSQAQLQQALVGGTFTTNAFMSTSYDPKKSPFLNPKYGITGGREVIFNVKAGANTKVLLGAKSQSEVIIDKGTQFKITGVQFSGQTATPRMGTPTKQLIVDIETI